MNLFNFSQNQPTFVLWILVIWEMVWKGMALWKAAQKKQKYWFIALLVVNSLGILPIVYLLLQRKKKAR